MDNLELIVKDSGLDQSKATIILDKFKDYFSLAAEWEKKAKTIIVSKEDQVSDMKMARIGRLELREKRIAIENTRKELKEQSLREGKAIDGIANVLKALIIPIEEYLDKQENFVQIKNEAIAEAKRIEDERKAEEDRIAKEKANAEEQERIKKENAQLKADAEQKEKERLAEKKRTEDELASKNAEIQKQKDDAKADQERIQREANEKIVAEKKKSDDEANRIKLEAEKQISDQKKENERIAKELKDKKDAEDKTKADEEAKVEALRKSSDQKKLNNLWNNLEKIEYPDVTSKSAKEKIRIVKETLLGLREIIKK